MCSPYEERLIHRKEIILERSDYIVVFITAGSSDEAEKIAGELVNKKIAACVNVIPEVKSVFSWKGRMEKANELLLVVKTKSSLFKDVVELVKKIHKYEVPEIIALPIVEGSKDYLEWIDGVCRP